MKALLKASRWGNLSIMIPMISSYEELMATKSILEECKSELQKDKTGFRQDIRMGVMLEVPSAVMIAEHLAPEVDFFSLGTNDLIQYTMAVDRGNELLSRLYQSLHPSILMLIKSAISAAHRHSLKISVCGEMAADPLGAILLTGLGVDELSVNFQAVSTLKMIIRSISQDDARQMAEDALKMRTQAEIQSYLKREIEGNFPDLGPVLQFTARNANG